MSRSKISQVFVLTLIMLSCKNDDIVVRSVDEEIQSWLDTAGISAIKDEETGIYYYSELSNPSGNLATSGQVAAIYYTLYDLNDNVIATHQRGDGDSLIFKIGASAVYPIGVDFGIIQMREGETFNFILPPSQGYGALSSGAITNNFATRLQLQLVALHDELDIYSDEIAAIMQYVNDNDLDSLNLHPLDSTVYLTSGVAYKRRTAGIDQIPSNNETIVVDYEGRFIDETIFENVSGFTWVFGSDEPRALISGFEEGIARMQTNEEALLMIPSSSAYKESALVIPGSITGDLISDSIIPEYVARIPPYSTLLFEITRVD